MAKPLAGVCVVELGSMAAAAACGAQLAAWGAGVVKVEPPWGERGRDSGAAVVALEGARQVNPRFELHNRGKRSVAIDLTDPEGRSLAERLLGSADAFVTNVLPRRLATFGLSYEEVHKRHPHLVYGLITGYGRGTPDEDRRSFDHGAFWAQSGLAASYASEDGEPPPPSGGLGDRATGLALAGAICAALLGRLRGTLEDGGQLVTTSLLRTGMWLQGSVLSDALATGRPQRHRRTSSAMPTLNWFRCADGRLLMLEIMDPEGDWPRLVRALDDPALWPHSFGGGSRRELRARADEVVRDLERAFARRPLHEWVERLDREGVLCEPVLDHGEVIAADRVRAAGGIVRTEDPDIPMALADPCTIGADPAVVPRAPSVGEHTAQVLGELGVGAGPRSAMFAAGAAGAVGETTNG